MVHGNILSYKSSVFRGFLTQPQNNDKKNAGKKLTLELPEYVNNKVALQFFILIYRETVSDFAEENLDTLDTKELEILFRLADMYLFDPAKILVKTHLKQRCKKSVEKNYPKGDYEESDFDLVAEDEREVLCNLFALSANLNIQYENFDILDALFSTYVWHQEIHQHDKKQYTLNYFEYVAPQRRIDDCDYHNWGGWFFRYLMKCVQHTKKLTWQKATKNISFKPVDKTKVEAFMQMIKTIPDYKKIYMNYKLMRDVLMTVAIKECDTCILKNLE